MLNISCLCCLCHVFNGPLIDYIFFLQSVSAWMSLFLIMELFKLPSSWYPFTAWKVPKYGVIPGTLFSCIQSEYRKIRTRNNSVFGHFSRSVYHYQKWCFLHCSYSSFLSLNLENEMKWPSSYTKHNHDIPER